jgi:hypothetical protein
MRKRGCLTTPTVSKPGGARGRSPIRLGHEAAGKQAGECARPAGRVRAL